jgi:hypothetical protein
MVVLRQVTPGEGHELQQQTAGYDRQATERLGTARHGVV